MIEVKNLVKKYNDHLAVDNLSFTIPQGGIYGFLGPNGAGKSTTMNIMTGCLAATSGTVLINGYDIFENPAEAKKSVGYLPEQPPLYHDMTPDEYLRFVAEAKGIGKKEIKEQVESAMEKTGVTEMRSRLIRNLSKGYRQRVGVAQAILGDPTLIILDEPTVGLDPKQILDVRDLICELGKEHTVILSSHILQEVSAVCDHIMIISHGKLIASQPTKNLTAMLAGSSTLNLTVRGSLFDVRAALDSVSKLNVLSAEPGEDGQVHVQIEFVEDADPRESVFFAMAEAKCPILQMQVSSASLEDIFIELTTQEEPDEDAGDEGEPDRAAGDEEAEE